MDGALIHPDTARELEEMLRWWRANKAPGAAAAEGLKAKGALQERARPAVHFGKVKTAFTSGTSVDVTPCGPGGEALDAGYEDVTVYLAANAAARSYSLPQDTVIRFARLGPDAAGAGGIILGVGPQEGFCEEELPETSPGSGWTDVTEGLEATTGYFATGYMYTDDAGDLNPFVTLDPDYLIPDDAGSGYVYHTSGGGQTTTPTSSMPSTIFSSAVPGDIIYRGSGDWYYLNKPGSNGTFFLKCVVSGGTPVLSWQEASAGICS